MKYPRKIMSIGTKLKELNLSKQDFSNKWEKLDFFIIIFLS